MKRIILVLLMSSTPVQSAGQYWLQASGGLLLNQYDGEIQGDWDHEIFESHYFNLDFAHNIYTVRNSLFLYYSLGIERLQSLSKLEQARIKTEGMGLLLRVGGQWKPKFFRGFGIGHSIGFQVYDTYKTQLNTPSLEVELGETNTTEELLFIINSFNISYDLTDHWTLFNRNEVRGAFVRYSLSYGVQYEF